MGVTDALDDDPPGEHVSRNFEASITQSDGRYEVALPWKADVRLADNKQVALNRMENVRKKLSKNKGLLEEYDQAIRFYQNSGIAERVDDEGRDQGAAKVLYYMPHQAVVRENSSSTKLRIVFDASSHCANSKSLNDSLESGPNLNPDLVALLRNFRTHPIALVADVEKAFLQIGVKEEDRDTLRFLWYKDPPRPNEPIPEIETWRMTRVTFGTTASPFLLAATLQHHFQAMESAYPGTARTLRKSVYVDDLLTGAASEAEAKRLYAEANEIFMLAGMRLHKWGSNSAALTGMFEENGGVERNLGQVANVLKVLGMTWKPKQDCLTFSPDQVVEFAQRGGDTKRFVLQTTARLYDPLGLLSPFVVRAKILFQEIWKRNLRWDDVLPEQLPKEWIAWCDELVNLKGISVSRYYATELLGNVTHRALHIYADASTVAYGAVVYLLTIDDTGATTTTLLLAKGRVAPLKEVTLPRLELMAGLIATRLYKYVKTCLEIEVNEVHFWTDSSITLHWITGDPSRWKLFVRNRVREIQSHSLGATWHHCPGKDNPADLMTRGLRASKLVPSDLWWRGLEWLSLAATDWPKEKRTELPQDHLEERQQRADVLEMATEPSAELLDISRFSSASKVNRTTAWIFLFLHNLKSTEKISGP